MAKNINTANGQQQGAEITQLRSTIQFMDCLSQGGFSEISSIAKLALSYLETPDGYLHIDNVANALLTIWGKADDVHDCIAREAEEVGCGYTDDAKERRLDALMKVRSKEYRGIES